MNAQPENAAVDFETIFNNLSPEQQAQISAGAEMAAGSRKNGKTIPSNPRPRPSMDLCLPRTRTERSLEETDRNLPGRDITRLNFIPAAPPPPEQVGSKAAQRRLKQLARQAKTS